MPPVRDHDSAQDPRAIALAINNAATDRWRGARPGERQVSNLVPRALRAKGYEPVAALISAWVGRHIDVGTVRSWWRLDREREESVYLPPPDAIVKRKGGTLLPGWADETIREWLSRSDTWGRAFKTDSINMQTYLAWDAANDEIDPHVVALVANNAKRGIVPIEQPERADRVPAEYLALGYMPMSKIVSEVQGRPVTDNTICTYWREDIFRLDPEDSEYREPYSWRMPVPDAIISRGPRGDLLPGWTEHTTRAWVHNRPGPGNRTRGEARRGTGLLGKRKIGTDAAGRDKFGPAADLALT